MTRTWVFLAWQAGHMQPNASLAVADLDQALPRGLGGHGVRLISSGGGWPGPALNRHSRPHQKLHRHSHPQPILNFHRQREPQPHAQQHWDCNIHPHSARRLSHRCGFVVPITTSCVISCWQVSGDCRQLGGFGMFLPLTLHTLVARPGQERERAENL